MMIVFESCFSKNGSFLLIVVMNVEFESEDRSNDVTVIGLVSVLVRFSSIVVLLFINIVPKSIMVWEGVMLYTREFGTVAIVWSGITRG